MNLEQIAVMLIIFICPVSLLITLRPTSFFATVVVVSFGTGISFIFSRLIFPKVFDSI